MTITLETTLSNIQNEVDLYLSNIETKLYSSLEVNKVCILTYSGLENTEYFAKDHWGVYVFYLTPEINIETYQELCEIWYDNIDTSLQKIPEPINGRFKTMLAGVEYCFYVGKSQKLNYRIAQHINQTTNPSTSGMKLSIHNRLLRNCKISYSFSSLKIKPKSNITGMRILNDSIERKLRENLHPRIGKQLTLSY